MGDKIDFGLAGYVLGITSIITGVFSPVAGFILGIVGLKVSNREKTDLSKRGAKLSKIGMIVSVIMFILIILVTYFASKYMQQFGFPAV